jgi:hypothetical protein
MVKGEKVFVLGLTVILMMILLRDFHEKLGQSLFESLLLSILNNRCNEARTCKRGRRFSEKGKGDENFTEKRDEVS